MKLHFIDTLWPNITWLGNSIPGNISFRKIYFAIRKEGDIDIEWNLGTKHENLAFYEMFWIQYTLLRAKIIDEMVCRNIKCKSSYENSLKDVY